MVNIGSWAYATEHASKQDVNKDKIKAHHNLESTIDG